MEDRDTKGDLYEYMLGKIATAGQNGQFRTPRHIIRLMVEMTAPTPKDIICDPACGTCGFLVAAGEYLRERYPELLRDAKLKEHFHQRLFHGFDFDNTMLRIGSMNMLLHGVENPDIRYRDSLAQDHADERGELHPRPRQSALCRLARLREHRQGPPADRQDQEDRAALPRPLPAPAQARRPRRRHRARRRPLRLQQGPQGAAPDPGRGAEARRRRSPSPAASSSPTPASPPPSSSSPRPTPAAPTTSGSTTSTPTAGASTTSAPRSSPRKSSAPSPGAAHRSGTREEQPARHPRPLAATRQQRAQAPPHRPELLRPQGRHRRPGLRPLPQPLQGGGPRRGRPPPAEGDPRRPAKLETEIQAGDEGAGGDAEVRTVRLGEIAESLPCDYGDEPSEVSPSFDVVKVSNVNGEGRFHGDFEKRGFRNDRLADLLVKEGDLLVVKSSGSKANILSGKTAICGPDRAGRIVASNFLLRLRVDETAVVPRFLWYVLNSGASKAIRQNDCWCVDLSESEVVALFVPSHSPSAPGGATANCGDPGPGGGAQGQAPRRPRPARHPHPSHLPRPLRRSSC